MLSKAGSTFSFQENDLDLIQNYNKLLQNLILWDTPTNVAPKRSSMINNYWIKYLLHAEEYSDNVLRTFIPANTDPGQIVGFAMDL